MFVAVVGEFSQDDHRVAAHTLFKQYGLTQITVSLFESHTIKENTLARLKHDIDRVTDYYDIVRFYQYPLDELFVVTALEKKRWRRINVRP